MRPLPKYILSKLTPQEAKKLKALQEKSDALGHEMVSVQAEYVKAARKNPTDSKLPKIADKGFRYEALAFEAADRVNEFKERLLAKYRL
jgi:hypothetical protein